MGQAALLRLSRRLLRRSIPNLFRAPTLFFRPRIHYSLATVAVSTLTATRGAVPRRRARTLACLIHPRLPVGDQAAAASIGCLVRTTAALPRRLMPSTRRAGSGSCLCAVLLL